MQRAPIQSIRPKNQNHAALWCPLLFRKRDTSVKGQHREPSPEILVEAPILLA